MVKHGSSLFHHSSFTAQLDTDTTTSTGNRPGRLCTGDHGKESKAPPEGWCFMQFQHWNKWSEQHYCLGSCPLTPPDHVIPQYVWQYSFQFLRPPLCGPRSCYLLSELKVRTTVQAVTMSPNIFLRFLQHCSASALQKECQTCQNWLLIRTLIHWRIKAPIHWLHRPDQTRPDRFKKAHHNWGKEGATIIIHLLALWNASKWVMPGNLLFAMTFHKLKQITYALTIPPAVLSEYLYSLNRDCCWDVCNQGLKAKKKCKKEGNQDSTNLLESATPIHGTDKGVFI